jgi:undecaprenyl-diphosphatase
MLITFLADYLIWLLLAGLIYLWVIDGQVKKEVALHALLAYFASYSVAFFLKIIFHTTRPFLISQIPPLTITVPQDYAFPSGHAAMAFGLAVTVWRHNRRMGTVFVAIALLISFARVWAHVHWPIDIAGGAVVGTLVAVAIEKIHVFQLLPRKSKHLNSRKV